MTFLQGAVPVDASLLGLASPNYSRLYSGAVVPSDESIASQIDERDHERVD